MGGVAFLPREEWLARLLAIGGLTGDEPPYKDKDASSFESKD